MIIQARVVRKVDNAIHWTNHYPADSVVVVIYLVDNGIIQPSSGQLAVC